MKDSLTQTSWLTPVVRSVRHPPVDVLTAILLVAAVDVVVLMLPARYPGLRLLSGVLLLVVLPGYAVVSALFPAWRAPPRTSPDRKSVRVSGGELLERLALSLGAGVALVPVLALALDGLGFALGTVSATAALTVVVSVGLATAVLRRRAVPVSRQFRVGISLWIDDIRRSFSPPGATLLLELLLVVSVLGAAAGLGGALAFPVDGEQYSSFALRTETADGSLVAGEFPDELTVGDNESLVAVVENYEGERASYTIVVQLQRIQASDSGPQVVERNELARAERTLASGERWTYTHAVSPEMTGTGMRLTYLLYRGSVPSAPSEANAERSLHLWVDVTG